MRNIEIDIFKLDFTKPISYYSTLYDVCYNTMKSRFKRLGVYDKFIFTKGTTSTIKSEILKEKYKKNTKKCLNCNKIILYDKRKNDYCSKKCAALYTQKDGGHCKWSEEGKKKLSVWAKKYAYRIPKNGKNKICLFCGNSFYVSQSQLKKLCCSKKCSIAWINKTGYMKGKTGGYRKEAGRGKMGWYRGYYCNSSWELVWVIYQLEHGLQFKRNTRGFEYQFENRKYKFYPDFILDNGEYVEIKGWVTKKDKEKINQFKHSLKVIRGKDLKDMFDYVIDKYGKNYTYLYEKM